MRARILDSQSITEDTTSSVLRSKYLDKVTAQVDVSSASSFRATIYVECSEDESNWSTVIGLTRVISADGSYQLMATQFAHKYYRVRIDHSLGSATVQITASGNEGRTS